MPLNDTPSEQCSKCGETKPLDQFHKNKYRPKGHEPYCKDCKNQYIRQHRKKPEIAKRVRERMKAYREQNPSHDHRMRYKTTIDSGVRTWLKRNPGAAAAHMAVHHAVKDGILPPVSTQLCAHCGEMAKHYHHHLGYGADRRLDVIPLCQVCHRAEHTKTP